MQECGCHIWRKPRVADHRDVELFATKIHWKVVRIPVHMFVHYAAEPSPADFHDLAEVGLKYAKRAYSSQFLGMQLLVSSLAIIPCIVCDKVKAETIAAVTTREKPPRVRVLSHGLDIYPVLYCLTTNRLYHWSANSPRDNGVWTYSRTLIDSTIGHIIQPSQNSILSPHPQPPRNSQQRNSPAGPSHDNGNWWDGQNSA